MFEFWNYYQVKRKNNIFIVIKCQHFDCYKMSTSVHSQMAISNPYMVEEKHRGMFLLKIGYQKFIYVIIAEHVRLVEIKRLVHFVKVKNEYKIIYRRKQTCKNKNGKKI